MVNGSLFIPGNPKHVSWSSNDPRPGYPFGTVIMVSHINYVINGQDVEGAFHNLPDFRRGDRLTVTLVGGRHLTYQIVKTAQYSKAFLAQHPAMWPRIFNESPNFHPSLGPGHPHAAALVLTTCSGPFDSSNGNYLDNSFVTAYQV
jgi:hypothetical protein